MKKSANLAAKNFLSLLFFMVIVLGTNHTLLGQVSEGGIPYFFSNPIPGNIHTITMGPVNVDFLLAEDEAEAKQGMPIPFRFGFPFDVDLGLNNAGTWTELPNGDHIWRLRIIAPGAFSINLIYDEFWLPEGAKFFIYNANHSMLIGAFTAANNNEHGMFSTAPVKGNISILEYYEPAFAKGAGKLHISRVVHAYRNFFGTSDTATLNKIQGFGDSAPCQINVNCSEGASWADEKRAVVMILLSNGTRVCSGAMINNVQQDLTPYLLTAKHCLGGEATWIIMFNYESPNCSNIDGPTNQTVSGTTLKANNSASDFALLRLSTTPPRSYDVRYAGWSRSTTAPSQTVMIHHPRGDIKKIAFDNNQAISSTWPSTPSGSHWELYFDQGANQHGSSGAPYFNTNHQIVAQHHGNLDPLYNGNNDCDVPHAWGGKFSVSWDYGGSSSTRLKDWLDPNNTGPTTLNGMNDPRPYPPTNAYITGSVGTNPGVNWTASPSYISNYKVYRKGTYTAFSLIGTTTATNWVDSQITIQTQGGATDYYTYKVTAMGTNGWESESSNQPGTYGKPWCVPPCKAISQDNTETDLPADYALYQNYPNPFNPNTVIHFSLPKSDIVSVKVYNLFGQKVAALINNQPYEAGHYTVEFNAFGLASGVYFYRLQAGSFTATKNALGGVDDDFLQL